VAGADDLAVQDDLVIPGRELDVAVSRSSGPGGQHVNTTDTRVQLRWDIASSGVLDEVRRERLLTKLASRLSGEGVLTVACDTHRSQMRNREEARARLAALVRAALVVPQRRRRTRRPRGAEERRLDRKRRRADVKRQRRRPADD
jgi:ribosome-associated protein